MKQFVYSVGYSGYVRGRHNFIIEAETREEADGLAQDRDSWWDESWQDEIRNDTELNVDGEGPKFVEVQVEEADPVPMSWNFTPELPESSPAKCQEVCNGSCANCPNRKS